MNTFNSSGDTGEGEGRVCREGRKKTRGTVCEHWRWFSILVDTLGMVQYTSGYTGDGSVY